MIKLSIDKFTPHTQQVSLSGGTALHLIPETDHLPVMRRKHSYISGWQQQVV